MTPIWIGLAAIAVAAVALVLVLRPFGFGAGSASPSAAAAGARSGCPTSQPPALGAGKTADVSIETAKGTITITVHADWSPIAAGNFVALASCHFYEGVTFHRLVPQFVIQGGDPEGTGGGGPGYSIADEPVPQTYRRGVVAMARTAQPNSQGSQFFVVLDDQARAALEQANTYAVFGEVTSGMDVVDAIAAMPNSGEPDNAALEPVAMDRVTVVEH
jgi:peptidyl-prolyl cis-trans isomerase B (cyclophilin B)